MARQAYADAKAAKLTMDHDTFIAWRNEKSAAVSRNLNWGMVKDPQPGDEAKSLLLERCTYPGVCGDRSAAGEAPVRREVSKSEQMEEQRWKREWDEKCKAERAAEAEADKVNAQAAEVSSTAKANEEKGLAVEAAAGKQWRNEKKGVKEQQQEREKLRWEKRPAMIGPGALVWAVDRGLWRASQRRRQCEVREHHWKGSCKKAMGQSAV